jgi:hypothetical protein
MTMTSQTDPSASGQGPSRKDRRAAERSARKSGSPAPSTSQSSGRSMWLITGAAIAIALLVIVGLVVVSGGFEEDQMAAVSKPEVPAPALELRVGRSLGDPQAPVKIDVYEDGSTELSTVSGAANIVSRATSEALDILAGQSVLADENGVFSAIRDFIHKSKDEAIERGLSHVRSKIPIPNIPGIPGIPNPFK